MSAQVNPSHVMQIGMGFWGSKTLLSAVELELFTKLGSEGMTGSEIAEELGLDDRDDALPDGGAFIAIENIIDDARRENAFGLLMSLNMLIEFGEAFDFTGSDFAGWCKEAGFKETEVIALAGPTSAAIAYK